MSTPIHDHLAAKHMLGQIDWERVADEMWLELCEERDREYWAGEDE